MKASRMIELLQKTIDNHGDLDVVAFDRDTTGDGFVHKVTVRKTDEDGYLPAECLADDAVNKADNTEYVVLFTN